MLSTTAELAVDYFSLRGLDAQAQLMNATADAYRRALQLTQARYQQGVAAGTDVAQAQTQLDTTLAQTTDLAVARSQFEHAIAILIGKAPADLTIAPDVRPMLPPMIPVALPSLLVQRRSDVAAAERRVAAANAQIGVAQAAFFPTLSLSASGGLESAALADAAFVAEPILVDRALARRNGVRRRTTPFADRSGHRQLRGDRRRVSAERADGVSGRRR